MEGGTHVAGAGFCAGDGSGLLLEVALRDEALMNMIAQLAPTRVTPSSRQGALRSRLALECRPQVARMARRHAAVTLKRWGVSPGVVDDVTLIVSELVANADQHATGGPRELRLSMCGERLYIAVRDVCARSSVPSAPHERCADAERGRGLEIVRALVDEVGCHRSEAGKTVWAWMAVARPVGSGPVGLSDGRRSPARVKAVPGFRAQAWPESALRPAVTM
ncbi:ATP-binding protein [Streptomyces sp. NPDC085479]|uniref:ATP-binding protein n=1 Tax=Streptomyces sp. NPDC085479 TaxID=3365726 RepID=UPI0037D1DFC8